MAQYDMWYYSIILCHIIINYLQVGMEEACSEAVACANGVHHLHIVCPAAACCTVAAAGHAALRAHAHH